MSARSSDRILQMQSLHVPTRRENKNETVNVQLGTEKSTMERQLHTSHQNNIRLGTDRSDYSLSNSSQVNLDELIQIKKQTLKAHNLNLSHGRTQKFTI